MEEEKKTDRKNSKTLAGAMSVGTRGRTFEGNIIKKFDKRVVVEFVRTVRIAKFERFAKKKTRLHARIPQDMVLHEGDYVKVRECRPLSKIIRFVVVEVVRRKE